ELRGQERELERVRVVAVHDVEAAHVPADGAECLQVRAALPLDGCDRQPLVAQAHRERTAHRAHAQLLRPALRELVHEQPHLVLSAAPTAAAVNVQDAHRPQLVPARSLSARTTRSRTSSTAMASMRPWRGSARLASGGAPDSL